MKIVLFNDEADSLKLQEGLVRTFGYQDVTPCSQLSEVKSSLDGHRNEEPVIFLSDAMTPESSGCDGPKKVDSIAQYFGLKKYVIICISASVENIPDYAKEVCLRVIEVPVHPMVLEESLNLACNKLNSKEEKDSRDRIDFPTRSIKG